MQDKLQDTKEMLFEAEQSLLWLNTEFNQVQSDNQMLK